MVPPGTRNTPVQLATTSGAFATITQEPASSPACLPWEKSWSRKTISSPSANGEFGSRTLLASMSVNGLNTTSKVRVVDLAAAGSAACDAAELDITPTRPSTRAEAEPIKATLRMVPSSRPANRPLSRSGEDGDLLFVERRQPNALKEDRCPTCMETDKHRTLAAATKRTVRPPQKLKRCSPAPPPRPRRT